MNDAIAIFAMYLVTLVLFWPLIIEDTRFTTSGDAASARAWIESGEEIGETENVTPVWTPYAFLGFPTYGALAYYPGSWLNPMEHIISVGKYIFGPYFLNKAIFHYFLSGLLMYLFARGVGLPIWGALIAGMAFLLNPYNISLSEAGHAGKHWTITMMPLVFLTAYRAIKKQRLLDISLLGLAVAAQMLSLHFQIVYYTLLVIGGYAIVWFVKNILKDKIVALKGIGCFSAGGILGLGLSFFLFLPVYIFMKFSIRGAPPLKGIASDSGGLDWTYATNWSLHPLETLQFLVPGLFGLGGSAPAGRGLSEATALNANLYWGWMPFTMSSLYMGIIPLILAIIAVFLLWKKNGIVRWMAISGFLAVIVSFGRFLPVLYGPMYHYLPFFAKFRVPSMALVVTAAAVPILAGFGLAEVLSKIEVIRENESLRKVWSRIFLIISYITGFAVLFALFYGKGPDAESSMFIKGGELQSYDPQTLEMLVRYRWVIFTKSLLHTSLFLQGFSISGWALVNWKHSLKFSIIAFAGIAVLLTIIDLNLVDKRFIHPVSAREFNRAMAATPAVQFLKDMTESSEEVFRVYPLGSELESNNLMYHRVQSIGGNSAAKLRIYQDFLDYALGQGKQGQKQNLKIAGMMNAKYLMVRGIMPEEFEEVFADTSTRQMIYKNPYALPRAWFVNEVRFIEDPEALMDELIQPDFDPSKVALLSEEPDFVLNNTDTTNLAIVPTETYGAHKFVINTTTSEESFMVVSEIYYPGGWRAFVDGKETKIWRTDYGLRGVVVPAGEHIVSMEFELPELRSGNAISVTALIIILVLIGIHYLLLSRKNVLTRRI
ncbi:MAG: YfhO family protein [Candidatus Electryonea clarkiae]|nr:YfhO family protein [Candidatus Electryonea clarkiae]MDP8286776.1 YfhO family protein [Candidatus Electryonea clarkiae]